MVSTEQAEMGEAPEVTTTLVTQEWGMQGTVVERVLVQHGDQTKEDLPAWELAIERDDADLRHRGARDRHKVLLSELKVLEAKVVLRVSKLRWLRYEAKHITGTLVAEEHTVRARQSVSRARRHVKKKLKECLDQEKLATQHRMSYYALVARLEARVRALYASGACTSTECRKMYADGRDHWDSPPVSSSDSDGSCGFSEVDSDDSIEDDLRRATRDLLRAKQDLGMPVPVPLRAMNAKKKKLQNEEEIDQWAKELENMMA